MTITIKTLKSVFLITLLSILAGCGAEVRIVSPENNAVSTDTPEFRLRFKRSVPETFTATLNGTEIPVDSFTVDNRDAYMQIDANMLRPGNNVFAVTEPAEESATFYFEVVGPVVHILEAQGTDPKNITGYLTDKSGITSLTINGSDIALNADDSFTAEVADNTVFDLVATDVYGNESNQSFIKLGETFNPALAARVNQQGLDESIPNAILEILENHPDISSLITNPITETCLSAYFAQACANFSINGVTLAPGSAVSIEALPNNTMRVAINLNQLDLDTAVTTYGICDSFLCGGSGTIFGTLDFTGLTTVDSADIAGNFIITISNGDVTVGIEEGSLEVDLPEGGISVDMDFGAVEDIPFIGSLLGTVLEDMINGLLSTISGTVEDIANGSLMVTITDTINGFIADMLPETIAVPVADTSLNLNFSPELFSTSNGGFDFAMASSVAIEAADPAVLPPLGSGYVTGDAPNPYPTTAPDGTEVDLTATVSANLINQVLTEAYVGGLLDITLDESTGLTIGALTSIPDFPINLVGVTDFNIRVTGEVAPVVKVLPQAQSDQGVIFANLLDLTLSVNVDFGNSYGLQEIMNTKIDLLSPFDIGVNPDDTLAVGIEGVPEVNIHNVVFRLGGLVINEPNGRGIVTNLANNLMPQMLPKVLEAIGGIPVPSVAGFTLQLADVWNPNADNNAFIALAGNLVSAEATAEAVAPTVSASVEEQAFALLSAKTATAPAEKRSVTINVGGDNSTNQPLEYRYRINGGHWAIWKQRDSIELNHLPAGDNVIEVCSRTHLLKEACTQVSVSVPKA